MLRWLAGETPIRRLARGNLQRLHFGPAVLPLAFHDRSMVPAEIAQTLDGFTAADAARVLDRLLSNEEAAPPPKGSVLLLLGEADRSPVLDKTGARKMRLSLEQSRLVTIPQAGHLPQIEQPEAFVRELRRCIDR